MIAWMCFAGTVAFLAGLAAHGAERGLRLPRWPARWAWAASLAASLILPFVLPARPDVAGPGGATAP